VWLWVSTIMLPWPLGGTNPPVKPAPVQAARAADTVMPLSSGTVRHAAGGIGLGVGRAVGRAVGAGVGRGVGAGVGAGVAGSGVPTPIGSPVPVGILGWSGSVIRAAEADADAAGVAPLDGEPPTPEPALDPPVGGAD
jgi:hypothetical protein